jgi:SAM-dependent methyltransferase
LDEDTGQQGTFSYRPTHDDLRVEARSAYGADLETYELGRPDYPDQVYRILEERCGLRPGIRVIENGPGTGQVTRHLVTVGAHVVAVEPDPAMAGYLRHSLADEDVEIIVSTFEDVLVEDNAFDLAVAATSFHWVDQAVGLPKIGRIVRPDGWVALWWTIFGDAYRPDPFHQATYGLLGSDPGQVVRMSSFQLDRRERESDLRQLAGLVNVDSELIQWTATMDPNGVRALYASLINVIRLPAEDRDRVLDSLESVAAETFGGVVERPFVTVLYSVRIPADFVHPFWTIPYSDSGVFVHPDGGP